MALFWMWKRATFDTTITLHRQVQATQAPRPPYRCGCSLHVVPTHVVPRLAEVDLQQAFVRMGGSRHVRSLSGDSSQIIHGQHIPTGQGLHLTEVDHTEILFTEVKD